MAKAAATVKTVTVTAKQIVSALAEKNGLQKKSTIALFDDFFAAVTKSLKKGERIRLGDLGSLQGEPFLLLFTLCGRCFHPVSG